MSQSPALAVRELMVPDAWSVPETLTHPENIDVGFAVHLHLIANTELLAQVLITTYVIPGVSESSNQNMT